MAVSPFPMPKANEADSRPAPYCLSLQISLIALSPECFFGSATCLIVVPSKGDDEPEIRWFNQPDFFHRF
jgi:hypothetical protein